MTPEEAINAATINTAYAMDLSNSHGSITRGKVANVFITKEIPSYSFMPYSFGGDVILTTIAVLERHIHPLRTQYRVLN